MVVASDRALRLKRWEPTMVNPVGAETLEKKLVLSNCLAWKVAELVVPL